MQKLSVGKFLSIVLCLFVFQACSSSGQDTAELRKSEQDLVRSVVDDPARQARLLHLLEQRDQLVDKHIQLVANYRMHMQKLNADYATSRQSIEQAIAEFDKSRKAGQKLLVELTAAMKKETTAEEWHEIAKFQLKNLNSRDLTYQQISAGV